MPCNCIQKAFLKRKYIRYSLNPTSNCRMIKQKNHIIDTLEDVMDMIVGWYPSRNIDFENEIKGL